MKAFLSILVVIILLGLLTGVVRGIKGPTPSNNLSTRLQQCPDERIDNQMPGPGGPKEPYYVLKGERREISEFDEAWVAANCNVPTQVVY
jgi:hypothetical protein